MVFENAINLAANAIADDGSVAIRVPKDDFCKALLKRFGKPVISTSANFSGEKSAAFFGEISPALVTACDYVVSYRQTDTTHRKPSCIVRIDGEGVMTVLRP